jgi:hypothetical protein
MQIGKIILVFLFFSCFESLLKSASDDTNKLIKSHPLKSRVLASRDELEEDYTNQRGVNQMKMMMTNMKRDNGMKNIEMALNEIGDEVEEINESMMAKLSEFTDAIERVKSQQNVARSRKAFRLPPH